MTARKPWSFAAGQKGRPHRVTVFENPQREWTLTLRWTVDAADGPKRKIETLEGRKLRTAKGVIIKDVERWAKAKAQEKYESLMRGDAERMAEAATADAAAIEQAPLTIGETDEKLTDPAHGKYPTATQHRRETLNALNFARTVWGSQRTWNSIVKADIRALGRARIQQLRKQERIGLAGAEHTVQRILTVAQWLRDEELIEPGACVPPKNWKEQLSTYWVEVTGAPELPAPFRPRFTIEEALKIADAAGSVDPRLEVILWLAPNQRMAQVARLRRSNIDLAAKVLRIPTRGRKKKGAVIAMSDDEFDVLMRALTDGYLRDLEKAYLAGEITDYPVFPAGSMPGSRLHREGRDSVSKWPSWRPPSAPTATVERHVTAGFVDRGTIADWFAIAEEKAGVPHVEKRGPRGARRTFVDEAKKEKISREGLTSTGGWADPQMADRIYADEEQMHAAEEARDVRTRIRKRVRKEQDENEPNPQQTTNSAPETESAVGRGVT
jgi:integrase